jgi:hypothetical protein
MYLRLKVVSADESFLPEAKVFKPEIKYAPSKDLETLTVDDRTHAC